MPTIVDEQTSSSTLPHTIEVRKGWAARLYLWTYRADENTVNSCKLFWAFMLMPIVMPFVLLGRGFVALFDDQLQAFDDWLIDRSERKSKERWQILQAELNGERQPSRLERFLEAWSHKTSGLWFKLQSVLRWAGIVLGIVLALALIVLVVMYPLDALIYFATGVGILIACAVGVGLFALIVRQFDKNNRARNFGRLMRKLGRSVHDHTCANVKFKDD